MARLAVEYRERYLKDANYSGDFLENVMRDYNIKSVSRLISMLNRPIKLPEKTRDIYYYLPFKMMNIIPTIDLFSNINLKTGQNYKSHLFILAEAKAFKSGVLYLSNGMRIAGGVVTTNNGKIPINKMIVTYYKDGKLKSDSRLFNIGSPNLCNLYARLWKSFNFRMIECLIQAYCPSLFVLGRNYEPKHFWKPVYFTPILPRVFNFTRCERLPSYLG